MNKIKVEFHRTENFVYGRVLEMPEEIRNTDLLVRKGVYTLYSISCPEIRDYGISLYLRGTNKTEDSRWFSYEYSSIEKAMEAITAFKDLIKEWNEKNVDVLDEKEREYLSVVLRPFKNRNVKITKRQGGDMEHIEVKMKRKYSLMPEDMEFPYFDAGTMYKGMEESKEYTLEELKLVWKEI